MFGLGERVTQPRWSAAALACDHNRSGEINSPRGQLEPENTAACGREIGADGAGLGFNQMLHDGEAETVARLAGGGPGRKPRVLAEQLHPFVRRYAGTGIADLDSDPALFAACAESDVTA